MHQILKFKGFCSDDLIYNKDGAPFLKNGLKISISHSGLFVAVCLSKEKMGIDLQTVNEKILKVVDKFTNQIEKKLMDENNLEKLSVSELESYERFLTLGDVNIWNWISNNEAIPFFEDKNYEKFILMMKKS